MYKWFIKHKVRYSILAGVIILSILLGSGILSVNINIGNGKDIVTIGNPVYATGTLDYTFNGDPAHDTAQMQDALNALPTGGGRIEVLTGNVIFNANITRAIDNVTIDGTGAGTYFARDGFSPIFIAGGDNWTCSNFATDLGGVDMGATTGGFWLNLKIGSTYYACRSWNGRTYVDNVWMDLSTPSLGEVVYYDGAKWIGSSTILPASVGLPASASIGDILKWNGSSWVNINVGSANQILASNGTSPYWSSSISLPTGRGATYVVAASDASANVKAQADYVCDGANDEVQFLAAITALPTTTWTYWDAEVEKTVTAKTGILKLIGTFTFDAVATITDTLFQFKIDGYGARIKINHTGHGIVFDPTGGGSRKLQNIAIAGLEIEGNKFVAGGTGAGDDLQFLHQANNVTLFDCKYLRAGRDGVHLEYPETNSSWWNVTNCRFGDYEVVDDSVSPWIRDGNKRYDLFLQDIHHINIVGNHFEGTGGTKLYLYNFYQVQVIGNEFSYGSWNGAAPQTAHIFVDGTTVANTQALEIVGNNFENGDYLLRVMKANGLIFANNTLIGGPWMLRLEASAGGNIINANVHDNTWTQVGSAWQVPIDLWKVQYSQFHNNTFCTGGTIDACIRENDATCNDNTFDNNKIFATCTIPISLLGSRSTARGNIGYIAKGEIRTYSGTITGTASDNGSIMLSIDNPFGQAVRVLRVDLEITVQASAAATIDCGIGASVSADYTAMVAALPINPGTTYPYFYSSTTTVTYGKQTDPINWATGSGNRYLNFFNPSANPSGTVFVATYTITIMGN